MTLTFHMQTRFRAEIAARILRDNGYECTADREYVHLEAAGSVAPAVDMLAGYASAGLELDNRTAARV